MSSKDVLSTLYSIYIHDQLSKNGVVYIYIFSFVSSHLKLADLIEGQDLKKGLYLEYIFMISEVETKIYIYIWIIGNF